MPTPQASYYCNSVFKVSITADRFYRLENNRIERVKRRSEHIKNIITNEIFSSSPDKTYVHVRLRPYNFTIHRMGHIRAFVI